MSEFFFSLSPVKSLCENLLDKCAQLAFNLHSAQKQVRKYTGQSYFTHCESVVINLLKYTNITDPAVIGAAYLHDVVEDVDLMHFEKLMNEQQSLNYVLLKKSMNQFAQFRQVRLPERYSRLCALEALVENDLVVKLVDQVTDVSIPEDGNRATRKKLDAEHLCKASPYGQSIKLADIMDNTESIAKYDPKFAEVYLEEKRYLLNIGMYEGGPKFREAVVNQLDQLAFKLKANKLTE